ncbi:Uncharacterized protein FKW44_010920, partial [Caligus rogercresseyi]
MGGILGNIQLQCMKQRRYKSTLSFDSSLFSSLVSISGDCKFDVWRPPSLPASQSSSMPVGHHREGVSGGEGVSLSEPQAPSVGLFSELGKAPRLRERVSPSKLCISLLIRDYSSSELRSELSPSLRTSLIQGSDPPAWQLFRRLGGELPKGLCHEWRRSLALTIADGNALSDAAEGAALSRSSLLGLYFKKLILNFEALNFAEVSHLYENFKDYYNRGMEETGEQEAHSELPDSHPGSELYIARQVELLSKVEHSADPPDLMQKRIAAILQEDPSLTPAYFLTYLNCLRSKEYAGAIRSLHMAFAPDLRCPLEEVNKECRYSALNLSALHSRFHHEEEAMAALKEAITLAQDANDTVCLQHALSWIVRIRKEGSHKETLMRRCVSKSGELNLSYLVSLGIMSLGVLLYSKSQAPSKVMELLHKTDVLNCQHSLIELITSTYAQNADVPYLSILLLNLDTSDPNREGLYVMSEAYVLALCNVARYLQDQGDGKAADKVIDLAKQ